MISTITMDDIRDSVGYGTVCQALDYVFDGIWSIVSLNHGDAGCDFRMSVMLPTYSLMIYIDLNGTFYRKTRTSGVIAVSVPTPRRHRGLTEDGKVLG